MPSKHSHDQPVRRSACLRLGLHILIVLLAAVVLSPVSSYAQQANTSWSTPIDITQGSTAEMGSFDLLLCDPYQNAYLMWAEQSNSGAAVYLRLDAGNGWSTAHDVIVTPGAVIFGLAAAIAKPTDTLHLIWSDQYLRGDLYYSQAPLAAVEEPRSWTTPQLLAQGTDWSSIKTDSKGTVHIVYGTTDNSGVEHTIYHIQSTDTGKTWSEPVVAYSVISALPAMIRPELAIDGRDRLHMGISLNSYEYGAYSEVGYIRSEDGGQTWGTYHLVQNKGSTFQGVAWIAPYAFGDDEIHLTWHDPRRMHTWSTDGGKTWHDPQEIMPLAAAFGGRNELTQDSAGVLHVVTAVGDGVYSASWNGTDWSAPEQIDNRFVDPHGQTIVACRGNQLHVAYYDRTGENKVWYSTRLVNAPPIERRPVPTPVSANANTTPPTPTIATTILTAEPELRQPINTAPPNTSSPLKVIIIPFLAAAALIVVVAAVYIWKGTH
jgi:hypothetical protein